jgi:hypothetical protein
LIRRIATLGLTIPAPPKSREASRYYLPLSSDAKAEQGAENAEIGCRIGAKSGAAFRRNHLPLSTEIRCCFAPIFAIMRARNGDIVCSFVIEDGAIPSRRRR